MEDYMNKIIIAVGLVLALTVNAHAAVNAAGGIAIKGYDPVAYFITGRPAKGNNHFEYAWMGAKWHFVDKNNMDAFKASPEQYAPQYGGYCAYGMSKGQQADIDPQAWTIHDGKLYLNFSPQVRFIWSRDLTGNVAKADENWKKFKEE